MKHTLKELEAQRQELQVQIDTPLDSGSISQITQTIAEIEVLFWHLIF